MKVLLAAFVLVLIFLFLSVGSDSRISEITTAGEDYTVSLMGECLRNGSSQCYRDVADKLFEKFELPVILAMFERNEDKQAIFSRCHEVTHYLGRKEFLRTRSVPESYKYVTSVCHGGSYHGVIEGYFDYRNIPLNDTSTLEKAIKKVCGRQSDYAQKTVYNECIHGVGHAMMFITEGELADSLKFCDTFSSRTEQTTCYGGVFMENSSSSTNLDHPSKYIKVDDPMYPCNVLEERYLATCYSYQSSHFALISHHEWPKVIELCRSVPESYRNGCFRIIGSNQVGFSQDMSKRRDNCELISEDIYRDSCFAGVVDGLVGRFNRDFPMIVSFCSILDDVHKEGCYAQVGASLIGWVENAEDLDHECRTISEKKYIPSCLKAGAANASGA